MAHAPTSARRHDDDEEEDSAGSSLPPPPDGGWGWVVVFASFMIHIVTDGVTYSFGLFYSEFLDYFGESKGATAWIASILVGVTLCSGPISSSFVNKYGCRAVTIAGAILASSCMALSIFAKNVTTLYFTIGIGTGLGFGLIYLPAIVSVTCYFEKYRSLATGIAVCGSGLGTFIFAPLTEYLISEFGWRGALIIISALVLNCIIMGALFRPVPVVKSRSNSVAEIPMEEGAAIPTPTPTPTPTPVLGNAEDLSDRDLHTVAPTISNGIHRPHSIGNFALPRQKITQTSSNASGQRKNGSYRNSEIARLALSQPALLTAGTNQDYKLTYGSQSLHRRTGSGVMYRKDVFYTGSLHNIPSNKSTQNVDTAEEEQLMHSSQRISNGHIYLSTTVVKHHRDRVKMCGCVPCSRETRDTFTEMLDFSLFQDPIFIIFTVSNFFTSIGFNIPYVYIVAQAEERGITKEYASYLLAIIGIANTVGRIVLGYVSDKPWINRLWVYNICLTLCGVGTALSAFCYDFYSFAFYAALFGFTIGAYVGLTSVILVDLLGLDRLTNAFGLLLLFQGLASLVGPPIAGWLYDAFYSYNPGFWVAGVTIAISGIMLFAIPSLQRYLLKRKNASKPASARPKSNAHIHVTAPSP